MYTNDMRRAFHSVIPPKNFGVTLIDDDNFITIKLDEKELVRLSHDDKIEAIQYVIRVKDALEQNGAIVLVTREPLK